jgi:hypothetical protein
LLFEKICFTGKFHPYRDFGGFGLVIPGEFRAVVDAPRDFGGFGLTISD